MNPDVVIVGGGPSGSVCASQLRRKGLSVVVLEKVTFPRFHLGESLLPRSIPILEEIGALDAVRAAFLPKYGARFHDDVRKKKDRFAFDGAWQADGIDHAFQVPRDAFDALLLDHARSLGADVREQWTATKLITDDAGRACGVEVTRSDGTPDRISARFVVDASGRDALTAHAARSGSGTTKIDGLDQTALYAHFEGIPRQPGKLEGDIDIVLFANANAKNEEDARPNWFWFIPFKDGRTSVGAVVSLAWMRDRRQRLGASPDALFAAAVAESTTATELLSNAKRLWPRIEATADFSYRVSSMRGSGWVAIGDAGGFIDPLFSTGAHLGMMGGKLAAEAIADALSSQSGGDDEPLFAAWEARVRAAAETFILAVQSFYAGPLVEYLFMQDKHAALRRSITSLLAGDVFGDAIWLRDTRLRLKEMLGRAAH